MAASSAHVNVELSSSDEDIILEDSIPTPGVGASGVKDDDTTKKKRVRGSSSDVWKFFEKVGIKDGKEKCKCKGCGKFFGCATSIGTSHLHRHSGVCKKLGKFRHVGQMLSDAASKMSSRKLDQKMFRKIIAEAIVTHDLPYSFCEYKKVREAFTFLNADVKFFSRHVAVNEINELYLYEKNKLKDLMANIPSKICLTSDVWTAITNVGYIVLTAHFIDLDWCLKSKILNFYQLPTPHTGVNLSNIIMEFLKDWGIEKKIFSITLDNAANNTFMVNNLREKLRLNDSLVANGEYFHVRCSAHILNLIVQDGITATEDALHRIRASVLYVKNSESRMRQFKDCVVQCYGVEYKIALRYDVSTRWNSTYLMLQSALKYKQAFQLYSTIEDGYVNCPDHTQWRQAERIRVFLEPFYYVTRLMSGSSYPTSNVFFSLVVKIEMLLTNMVTSDDQVIVDMTMRMQEKFDKYWSDHSMLLSFGFIFDPRAKLEEVKSILSEVGFPNNVDKAATIEMKLRNLFKEYTELYGTTEQASSTQQPPSSSSQTTESDLGSESINVSKIKSIVVYFICARANALLIYCVIVM